MSMTPRYAADLMLEPSVQEKDHSLVFTNFLLRQIAVLDEQGAWEWSLRWHSFYWFLVFAVIRLVMRKRGGVDWYALTHGAVTGIGGLACAYLSFVSAESLTGTPEPLGSVLCHGPLTSLHRILPTASVGYSVFDLIDGIHMGPAFIAHGCAMFLFSFYIVEVNMPQVLAVMLALEFSTIFLNFVRCEFFTPAMAMANMLLFVVAFFAVRIVYGPYAIYQHSYYLYTAGRTNEASACLPTGFDHVIFITGMFFNVLNAFWFYKILKKLQRKLNGTEGIKASNELGPAKDKKEQD
ncbi:expressed unknown protein [Seminavis robusta]|uniref:TLC domain-containing protein n=1 Tax=Seminavis robusta TaxID=568900 RepID=A0A9N8EXY5_9STRA|nr:expressed unknown protein [Seminavis robusta]|eukprot:Sro1890_g303700.1 n/a (294) ;mRNA; f:9211-10466